MYMYIFLLVTQENDFSGRRCMRLFTVETIHGPSEAMPIEKGAESMIRGNTHVGQGVAAQDPRINQQLVIFEHVSSNGT